jgi:hypothetical protein
MPDYETVSDYVAVLKEWSSTPPAALGLEALNLNASQDFGERHGSWVFRLLWEEDNLSRSVELALTNTAATPDTTSGYAYFTIRSAASSDTHFVIEDRYNSRRSIRRTPLDWLETQVASAIDRSRGFTPASLTSSYLTGTTPQTSAAGP